eukprot:928689-Karenia_brevis.AAC.1
MPMTQPQKISLAGVLINESASWNMVHRKFRTQVNHRMLNAGIPQDVISIDIAVGCSTIYTQIRR